MSIVPAIGKALRYHAPRVGVLVALSLAGAALLLSPASASQAPGGSGAPSGDGVIPGRYIVVLEEGASPAAVASDHGVAPDLVYGSALNGFAAPASAGQANGLSGDPRVASVEPDRIVNAIAQTLPTGVDRIEVDGNATAAIGNDGGQVPVTVAIVDSGIDLTHPDLNVSSDLGMTCASGKKTPGDQNGHGTHVAGTVGALDDDAGVVGVAPGAEVVPVRVLGPNGSGSLSCVVEGIDYVTANAGAIAAANMSLGWQGNSEAARAAIQASVAAGVVYTVAAGNETDDVYGGDGELGTNDDREPASYPEAATISALADSDGTSGGSGGDTSHGPDDSFATFSNFSSSVAAGNPVTSSGAAIDLMLPGVDIRSTYKDGGYATFSGTSMASPHAAGLAALHIADNGRATDGAGVAAIRQALIDAGRDQASGVRLADAHVGTEPDSNPENLGWAGSANAAPTADDVSGVTTDEDIQTDWVPAVSDPDGDALTCSIDAKPANGTATVASDCSGGTYDPDQDFNGDDSFTYSVSDGSASDTGTVSVTVSAVNDAPAAGDVAASTDEDTQTAWTPDVSDPDTGETLTCSIDAQPANGTATVASDCSGGTYDPDADFNGSDPFTYSVSDGSASDTGTVSVTVGAVNDAPTADAVSVSTDEDTSASVTLSGSDLETCDLTFSVVSGPANGSLGSIGDGACTSGSPNGDTATVDYTPDADFDGSDSFVYRVTDGDGATADATVSITVNAVNDAPVANDDSASTEVDTAVTVNVLANDDDVDGDALDIDRHDSASAESGSVSCDTSTGDCTYTPPSGFSGQDSFTYEATDGTAASNTATVTIGVSSPPTADPKSASTDEDTSVDITLSGSDPETCELTFTIVSGPDHGTVTEPGDQDCGAGDPNTDAAPVTYTPDEDFNGDDSFTYRVTDGDGAFDEATVSIAVNAVNDAPTADDASTSTNEDGSVDVKLSGSDPETCELEFTIVDQPTNGSLGTLSAETCTLGMPNTDTSTVTYTPDPNFNGEDTFTYKVSDTLLDSNTAAVTVTVSEVNDAPTAGDASVTTDEDTQAAWSPDVSDVDDSGLTCSIDTQPASGTATVASDCSGGTYDPDADFNGSDPFTYSVSDGSASDAGTVSVTVNPVNDAPVASDDAYSTEQDTTLSVAAPGVLVNDDDVDGDGLTAALVTGPSNGTLTLNADGSFTYDPDAGFTGDDTFTYKANDGTADSNEATVTIGVQASGFSEDFEGDVSGWSATGLWHLADRTGCTSPDDGYTSFSHSFYYGQESTCNYDTWPKENSGSLTSPAISGLGSAATLTFDHWREVELYTGGSFDRTWVEVSYDGGSSWQTVWSRDSIDASAADWAAVSVGLSPTDGSVVVRFNFDSVDRVSNDFTGWLIDDVAVE